jgi:hypothetical protein
MLETRMFEPPRSLRAARFLAEGPVIGGGPIVSDAPLPKSETPVRFVSESVVPRR